MSDVLKFPDKPEPKDPLVGPFTSEYRVVVEGREIPLLTGLPNGDKEDEMTLCVDRRFMISVPKEYAHRIAWLLAQGIAVASGYSHLGATTKDRPFAPRVHEISPGDIG